MGLKYWALHIAQGERVIIYMILGESGEIKMIKAYWWDFCGGILLKNKVWRGLGLVQQTVGGNI